MDHGYEMVSRNVASDSDDDEYHYTYNNNLDGILAGEMGLGKTIQLFKS
jgi:SNF2 family DNA or RNA helicase